MIRRIFLLGYLLLMLSCLARAQGGFTSHRAVTIDHTQVANTDQTNFIVPVFNTFTDMKSTGNGGSVTSTSGFDIIPTSDIGCATRLTFELAYYSPTTGQFEIHFTKSTLSHTVDYTFYLCYGKSSITTNQSTLTWTGYAMANHLVKSGLSSWPDSSPQANSLGDTFGGMSDTAGVMGRAALGINTGGISTGTTSGLPSGNAARTMSMWFKQSSSSGNQTICGYGDFSANGRWMIYYSSSALNEDLGGTTTGFSWTPDTNWHFLAWTLPASGNFNQAKVYYDGALQSVTFPSATVSTTTAGITCSQLTGSGSFNFGFPGSIDEFRINSVVESADWIATEYNAQKPSSTFLSFSGASSSASNTQIGATLTGP